MKALIVIDLINDIVVKRGYLEKLDKDFFKNISKNIKKARENGFLIIHTKIGFSKNYENQPKNSPLFGKAHEFGILKLGNEGTEFYNKNDIEKTDIIIEKSRVNPFYKTGLDDILKKNNITDIYISGIATDLAISSCAREGHDRDYNVTILSDLCASINEEDHENELKILEKICKIKTSSEIFLN